MWEICKEVLRLFVLSRVALANPTNDMNSFDISKNDCEMKDTDGKVIGYILRLETKIGG